MRYLITILFAFFLTSFTYADCGFGGFYVLPSGYEIKKNSIFIIQGDISNRSIILALNKNYPVYLKSDTRKINLLVQEIHLGKSEMVQAVLKPEFDLQAGVEYIMCIDNVPERQQLHRYNESLRKYEPLAYIVVNKKDVQKPIVPSIPTEIDQTYYNAACGPSRHIIFSNTGADESELFIKTTLKNLQTGQETTFYLIPTQDKISVGYGMCGGPFHFNDGPEFEIEFSYMDASGNIKLWSGPRIHFTMNE